MGAKVLTSIALLAGSILLALAPMVSSDYGISVLLDLLMWVSLTASWIVLSGFAGYFSLAHSAFYGLGAYFMAMVWMQIPYVPCIILAGCLSAGFAMAIGFPFLRVRGPYFVILTLGLTEITKYIFINLEIKFGGTVGRILMGAPSLHTMYYSMLIVCIVTLATAQIVKHSRLGTALFAIREDEDAAGAIGVNAPFSKWIAFGISAFFPGMVGAIMALRRSYIDPYTVFDPVVSFLVIVMAFLGGISSVQGAVVGAVLLTLLSELLWAQYPYSYMIILGVIMVFIVKFMPEGVVVPVQVLLAGKKKAAQCPC